MSKLLSTKIISALFVACALSSTVSAQAQIPVTPQPGQVLAPAPLNFIDVNSGRFGKLDIDMVDGQFYSGAADHLHLTARNLDLGQGELKALDIVIDGAHLQDFIVDKLTISTEGALNFDSGLVFNQKLLQFTSPATAQVTAQISEESLNKFLKAPSTLERLSVTAGKTGSLIANLLGNNGGNFGLTVDSAEGKLQRNNKIHIAATGKVGVSQLTIPLKAEVESKLFLQDGWVQVGETKLMTRGQEISPQLAEMLLKKIKNLSNLGHRSDYIHFAFTDIKVQAGKQLVVTGTAQINRLRFGR